MAGGVLLVLDIKHFRDASKHIDETQFDAFIEAVKEVNDFERKNKIYVGDAIAYKVGFANFTDNFKEPPNTYGTPKELIAILTSTKVDYISSTRLPLLIFIVFPEDICSVKTRTAEGECPVPLTPPDKYTALNDYRLNYKDSDKVGRLIANDWQYRNEDDALAPYLVSPEWINWGSAMFLASNNFAEGVRNSAANCENSTHGYEYPPFPSPYLPPINLSGCVSDPIQRWASSSLDYLVPSFGPVHATTITTDQFQNALDYLTAIGLNYQWRLMYSPQVRAHGAGYKTRSNSGERKQETDAH